MCVCVVCARMRVCVRVCGSCAPVVASAVMRMAMVVGGDMICIGGVCRLHLHIIIALHHLDVVRGAMKHVVWRAARTHV